MIHYESFRDRWYVRIICPDIRPQPFLVTYENSQKSWYTLYCCCYHANANPWRDSFLLVLQYSARKYAAYTSLIYFLFALYTTMCIPLLGWLGSLSMNRF